MKVILVILMMFCGVGDTTPICTTDLYYCGNGIWVGRIPELNCEFRECPASSYPIFKNGFE